MLVRFGSLVATVLISFGSVSSAQAADARAVQLLTEARDAWDIGAAGQEPFRLVIALDLADTPCDLFHCLWSFEWYSEHRWRQELSLPTGQMLTIRNGDLVHRRSPRRIGADDVAWLLVDALSIAHHLGIAGEGDVKKAKRDGDRVRFGLATRAPKAKDPVRRAVVIEGSPPRLSAVHPKGIGLHYEYLRDEVEVGERAFPRTVRVLRGKHVIAEATVAEVSAPVRPAEEALVPPEPTRRRMAAANRPLEAMHCESFRDALRIAGSSIRFNPPSGVSEERVTVRYAIAVDGRVVDAEVLAAPRPKLEKLALETMGRWRFRPAQCDGEPIQVTETLSVTMIARDP